MIYITGVQPIRILKRLRRRLVRLMTPTAELAGLVHARTVSKRLLKLRKETHLFWDNSRKDREHLKELSEGLTLTDATGHFQHVGFHFAIHKKFVMSVLSIAAPAYSVFLLLSAISYWSYRDYDLVLSYGGRQIATAEDESVSGRVTEVVNQRMVYNAAVSANSRIIPTFVPTTMDNGRFYAASTLCDRLVRQPNRIIEEGNGLHVDRELVDTVKSSAGMIYFLQSILDTVKTGDQAAKIFFFEDVETINGLFLTASIISAENMAEKLTGSGQVATMYTVKGGDTATPTARQYNLTLSELNRLNNNQVDDGLKIGMQLNVQTPQTLLHVKIAKRGTRTISLSYKTVIEKDGSQYTNYPKIVTRSQGGAQEITEEVTYVNGIETSRIALNKRVVTEAVDKRVVTGTKKCPQYNDSGGSNESLMWPVPSIRNITGCFAYRWDRVRVGINTSGGNSYGKAIVTVDGSAVPYVKHGSSGYGYHLQINHGNGISTPYGHTNKILVSSGQRVSKSQPIALTGSTGDSTGAHLHFEAIKNS